MKHFSSCVTPEGHFRYGIHKPAYTVTNLRPEGNIQQLGIMTDQSLVDNRKNFPDHDIDVDLADWIFEIPNPFPFRGVTFIDKEWADATAEDPQRIKLPQTTQVSFSDLLRRTDTDPSLLGKLPAPMLLALATCSTDPKDLMILAELSCDLTFADNKTPEGLCYTKDLRGRVVPVIHNHTLFEAVANNPALPDSFKTVMVLRPGAQGGSEIVGEWTEENHTHVYEYLRRNSYIAGGHYAANMADDSIRYSIDALTPSDIKGLRHLYYQRTYIRLAHHLGITLPDRRRPLSSDELEELRQKIVQNTTQTPLPHFATLWGWNFGFDYAPSKYRLHASHQQIHQQYSMIPESVSAVADTLNTSVETIPAYCCGDMIAEVIEGYRDFCERDFFNDYLQAMKSNARMDDRDDRESDLLVWQDERVMLFVPKAQTSQWELQLMTKQENSGKFPGNVLETDPDTRKSLDTGILKAQKVLAALGARMVTSIEYSKRLGRVDINQPLIYAFLPRLPESPGAFSEAQLRFINGHYPEDFAQVCRRHINDKQ